VAAASLSFVSASAHATFYVVDGYEPDGFVIDGQCSFREAVWAANNQSAWDSCPAGESGMNQIQVADGQNITLSNTDPIYINSSLDIYSTPGSSVIWGTNDGNSYAQPAAFVVQPGGWLQVDGLRFSDFTSTVFEVDGGWVAGEYLRGHLKLNSAEVAYNRGPEVIHQTVGILNNNGLVTIWNSTMHDNTEAIKGGAILNNGGGVWVGDSSFYNNVADQYGGAIHNIGTGAMVGLSNVTVSGNAATGEGLRGGGIYAGSGTVTEIVWSTITNNSAANGAGIWLESGATVRMKASIVSGNANLGHDCAGSAFTSWGYNILTDCPNATTTTGDQTGVGALLSPLMFPAWDQGALPPWHSPESGSPAIAAVPDGAVDCNQFSYIPNGPVDCTTFNYYDQIGNYRIINGASDIGSIQHQ